jgi:hypothetical protein
MTMASSQVTIGHTSKFLDLHTCAMTMALSQVTIGSTLNFLDPHTCAVTASLQVTKARTSKPLYQRPHLKIGHLSKFLNLQTCAMMMAPSQVTLGHKSKPFDLRVSMSLLIIVLPLSCIRDLLDLFI